MPELNIDFSWSKTRDDCFRRCQRQYYFTYYGSWGGGNKGADERTRTLYVLKHLRNRQMWAGENVHRVIRAILEDLRKGGTLPDKETLLRTTLEEMRNQWRDSGEGAHWENPRGTCALWEHEYDIELPDREWKAIVDYALKCIRTFLDSETFRRIAAAPRSDWLEVEERSPISIDGFKAFVQLDFACREDDRVVVYDWKTGRADTESTREQLGCYAIYAGQRWSVPAGQIVTREFNLGTNEIHERTPTAEDLQRVLRRIQESSCAMFAVHGEPEDRFPFTTEERICHTCNYLKACPRWLGEAENAT